MKKLSLLLTFIIAAAMLAALPVSAADPVAVCNVTEKAADIDGAVSEYEWDDATKLTLNITDTSTWSESGAGIVGTTGWSDLGHTDADFSNSLAFMVEGDYLYLLLTRTDSTLNFATDNFRTPYASDCSLMWFYDDAEVALHGLQLLASDKAGNPHIGYFLEDANQGSSVDLVESGDCEAVVKTTADSYVLEAKIKLSAIELSLDKFASGDLTVTYCAVNICEDGWDSDDGAHALWGTYNYQVQYKGVNNWTDSPAVAVIPQATFAPVVETPVVEEAPAEAAPAAEAAPVAEEAAPVVTVAAQTGDLLAVAVLAAIAGVTAIVKKRK